MDDIHSIAVNLVSAIIWACAIWILKSTVQRAWAAVRKESAGTVTDENRTSELLRAIRFLCGVFALQTVWLITAYLWMYDSAWWKQTTAWAICVAAGAVITLSLLTDRSPSDAQLRPRIRTLMRRIEIAFVTAAVVFLFGWFVRIVYFQPASVQMRTWVAANGGDLHQALRQHYFATGAAMRRTQ